jgi:mono/diheme cytochrome c family protein
MRYLKSLLALALTVASVACFRTEKSASGFRLPDGDAERGKAAFLELKCNRCHQVAGANLPAPELVSMDVVLGGEFPYARTDGELVTSIINPSYKLAPGVPRTFSSMHGKSLMKEYGDTMTVRQLTDIVAFLHGYYKQVPPQSVKN